MKRVWTVDQLGRDQRSKRWFCYPEAGLDVRVKVDGEDPQDVVDAANRIEGSRKPEPSPRPQTKGFWTLENIQAAKSLVREIVTIATLKGTLRPDDADAVVAKAHIIMGAVHANKPVEEIRLPL